MHEDTFFGIVFGAIVAAVIAITIFIGDFFIEGVWLHRAPGLVVTIVLSIMFAALVVEILAFIGLLIWGK